MIDQIKVMVVEDDLFAARTVELIMLRHFPELKLVGRCAYVKEAVGKIIDIKPDLLILDIELADGSAFDLLQALPTVNFKVLFMSSHHSLLMEAVRFAAVDYIQKPLAEDDFVMVLDKIIDSFSDGSYSRQLEVLFENVAQQEPQNQQIFVKTVGEEIIKVPVNSLEYGEALSQGACLNCSSGKKIIAFRPLRRFENMLIAYSFSRCHSRFLVNLQKVKFLDEEKQELVMLSGSRIPFDGWRAQRLMRQISDLRKKQPE
ncbi:LytR/AlgR family response regulator transcription factor [Geofilum sp. OHC36d9]|uniref:LytR/AlgR family response regulator transcription factor n=1 Tax=Geofilum sp. OHC36d9 TaxID=3458413 RepID=UPI0040346DF1